MALQRPAEDLSSISISVEEPSPLSYEQKLTAEKQRFNQHRKLVRKKAEARRHTADHTATETKDNLSDDEGAEIVDKVVPDFALSNSEEAVDDDTGGTDGSLVPRSAYVRLQKICREERIAFLKENSDLRQKIMRFELAKERQQQSLNATLVAAQTGSFRISPTTRKGALGNVSEMLESTTTSIAPVMSSPCIHAQQVRIEALSVALNVSAASRELQAEFKEELINAKRKHEMAEHDLCVKYEKEIREIKREMAKLQERIKVVQEAAEVQCERAQQSAEASASLRVENVLREQETLNRQFDREKQLTAKLQAEIHQWKEQGAKQQATIQQLQDERVVLIEEMTVMRNALDLIGSEQAKAHWQRISDSGNNTGPTARIGARARGYSQRVERTGPSPTPSGDSSPSSLPSFASPGKKTQTSQLLPYPPPSVGSSQQLSNSFSPRQSMRRNPAPVFSPLKPKPLSATQTMLTSNNPLDVQL